MNTQILIYIPGSTGMIVIMEPLFLDMRSTWALLFGALFAHFYMAFGLYEPVREYAGPGFFSDWDYYGSIDNTTWGNVSYVDRNTATREKLTYVDPSTRHAIIRVDNTTNIEAGSSSVYRNSVKITSKDVYPVGSLIVIDATHIPYGCSVWPAFRTQGTELGWPHAGELDLIKGNGMSPNSMVMHSDPGCVQSPNADQGGKTTVADCNSDVGCSVEETKPNSYGERFAEAGGGVFALGIDLEGVFMWFWSRQDVPGSITQAESHVAIDIMDWGKPSATYPAAGCDIERFFKPQKLILDITLCGQWADIPEVYVETCPGECISNVLGNGSNYATAYWEISYIRSFKSRKEAEPMSFDHASSWFPFRLPAQISMFNPTALHTLTGRTSESLAVPTIASTKSTFALSTGAEVSATDTSLTVLHTLSDFVLTVPIPVSSQTDEQDDFPASNIVYSWAFIPDPTFPFSPLGVPTPACGSSAILAASVDLHSGTKASLPVIHTSSDLVLTVPIPVNVTLGGSSLTSSVAITSSTGQVASTDLASGSVTVYSNSVSVTGVHFLVLVSLFILG